MYLTLHEQRQVVREVLRSHNIRLVSESNNRSLLRDEIRFNIQFYEQVKLAFPRADHLVESILTILGNIKDLLTGLDITKNSMNWFSEKIISKLLPYVDRFVPKQATDVVKQLGSWVKQLVSWLSKNLSYPGLAKLFAMIKYRTLRPDQDQIACMTVAAKNAYSHILMTLVSAFIIKLSVLYGPELAAINVSELDQIKSTLMSSDSLQTFAALLFGAYGSFHKHKKAEKLKADVRAARDTTSKKLLANFKTDWNKCNA